MILNEFTALDTITNGDDCWPDLGRRGYVEGNWVALARLYKGTRNGYSSVTARIELPDGRVILAQTTLALLRAAVAAFEAADQMDRMNEKLETEKGIL